MQDPIADMLCRIRNAQAVEKAAVDIPLSTIKLNIANVLKEEGYITDCVVDRSQGPAQAKVTVTLKYYEGKPVIDMLKRISRPGLRVYCSRSELPRVQNGLGIAIVSTPQGVMSSKKARKLGLGGEILAHVT